MRNLWEKYRLPLFDKAGGGGGDGGNGGDGGDGGDAGNTDGNGDGGDGGNSGDGGDDGSGPQLYRPAGLSETMFGETDHGTIDKLAAALKGYRDKDATDPVPKKGTDYVLGEVPDDLKPLFGDLEKDPVWDSARAMALKHGLRQSQFSGFITDLFSELNAAGTFADIVDPEKERQVLLPNTHVAASPEEQATAIDARMKTNLDWVENTLVQKGMQTATAEFLVRNLGDSAHGHQALEFFQKLTTETANPLPGGGSGETSLEDLKAREADPRNDPNSPRFDRNFADQTMRLWRERS